MAPPAKQLPGERRYRMQAEAARPRRAAVRRPLRGARRRGRGPAEHPCPRRAAARSRLSRARTQSRPTRRAWRACCSACRAAAATSPRAGEGAGTAAGPAPRRRRRRRAAGPAGGRARLTGPRAPALRLCPRPARRGGCRWRSCWLSSARATCARGGCCRRPRWPAWRPWWRPRRPRASWARCGTARACWRPARRRPRWPRPRPRWRCCAAPRPATSWASCRSSTCIGAGIPTLLQGSLRCGSLRCGRRLFWHCGFSAGL